MLGATPGGVCVGYDALVLREREHLAILDPLGAEDAPLGDWGIEILLGKVALTHRLSHLVDLREGVVLMPGDLSSVVEYIDDRVVDTWTLSVAC